MSIIFGQWFDRRTKTSRTVERERSDGAATFQVYRGSSMSVGEHDRAVVPYVDLMERCPICCAHRSITSRNGVMIQSCRCGDVPVPRRPPDERDIDGPLKTLPRIQLAADYARNCQACGASFRANSTQKRYCSRKCSRAKRLKPLRKKLCTECGTSFLTRRPGKMCSDTCRKRSANRNWSANARKIKKAHKEWARSLCVNKVIP